MSSLIWLWMIKTQQKKPHKKSDVFLSRWKHSKTRIAHFWNLKKMQMLEIWQHLWKEKQWIIQVKDSYVSDSVTHSIDAADLLSVSIKANVRLAKSILSYIEMELRWTKSYSRYDGLSGLFLSTCNFAG